MRWGGGDRMKNKTFRWGVLGYLIPPQGCTEGSVMAAGAPGVAMPLSPNVPSPPTLPLVPRQMSRVLLEVQSRGSSSL